MAFNGFCCSNEPLSENKRKRKDRQILGSCQRAEKVVEHEDGGDTNRNLNSWNSSHTTIKISWDSQKIPGDLRLAVT